MKKKTTKTQRIEDRRRRLLRERAEVYRYPFGLLTLIDLVGTRTRSGKASRSSK